MLARGETGGHQLGIFLLAAHAAGAGVAAGHDLAEDGEVGHDVEIRLRAAERHAETRDDLVEDQQRTVLIAERADALVIVPRDRARAALGADRLEDDRRRAAREAVALEHRRRRP